MSFNMEIHNQGFSQFSIFESEGRVIFRPMEKDLDLENIHLLVRVHTIYCILYARPAVTAVRVTFFADP